MREFLTESLQDAITWLLIAILMYPFILLGRLA